ncbi:chemotaxis protein [Pyramidobacter sp. YE332]|uniref:chemotaxis protein n=1 Tax=Pyramidobacter sp. YE332 TaxID=3068894 RepID=UPI00294B396E|nr:chemotaxis protein [Pyramidobacter sp. YE332]WOL39567.1 chemotaxis protein [Pyramidobacter sp. YE332]
MLKPKSGLMIYLLTVSLLLSTFCWQSIAQAADVQRVSDGYLLSEAAMRDTIAGWTADRESARVLRQGLDDLRAEIAAQAEDTRRLVVDLRRELAAERAEYNRRIRRGRAQGLLLGLLVGAASMAIAK